MVDFDPSFDAASRYREVARHVADPIGRQALLDLADEWEARFGPCARRNIIPILRLEEARYKKERGSFSRSARRS
jgi:hypothetical protein